MMYVFDCSEWRLQAPQKLTSSRQLWRPASKQMQCCTGSLWSSPGTRDNSSSPLLGNKLLHIQLCNSAKGHSAWQHVDAASLQASRSTAIALHDTSVHQALHHASLNDACTAAAQLRHLSVGCPDRCSSCQCCCGTCRGKFRRRVFLRLHASLQQTDVSNDTIQQYTPRLGEPNSIQQNVSVMGCRAARVACC